MLSLRTVVALLCGCSIVPKVNSKWNVEVDGVPMHVRDLKRTVNSPSNYQTISHSDNSTADDVQLRRSTREEKLPDRFGYSRP